MCFKTLIIDKAATEKTGAPMCFDILICVMKPLFVFSNTRHRQSSDGENRCAVVLRSLFAFRNTRLCCKDKAATEETGVPTCFEILICVLKHSFVLHRQSRNGENRCADVFSYLDLRFETLFCVFKHSFLLQRQSRDGENRYGFVFSYLDLCFKTIFWVLKHTFVICDSV